MARVKSPREQSKLLGLEPVRRDKAHNLFHTTEHGNRSLDCKAELVQQELGYVYSCLLVRGPGYTSVSWSPFSSGLAKELSRR